MSASASASVVANVNVNVNGHACEYEENEHGRWRSVGADVSHVFQFARSSARQLSRGLEGQHPLHGHTLVMTLLGEVVYVYATAADMHDAVAMVAGTAGVGACPSTLQSALLQLA